MLPGQIPRRFSGLQPMSGTATGPFEKQSLALGKPRGRVAHARVRRVELLTLLISRHSEALSQISTILSRFLHPGLVFGLSAGIEEDSRCRSCLYRDEPPLPQNSALPLVTSVTPLLSILLPTPTL